ncbi:DNA-binding LacI/PurR family transcriptional regulator [Kribbella aluminosa]|uniref:DNA-binding LacI/PurR family transcriptional regulator n=1 Tax=Kribbella aluminosa TaxID=416017 RepID=A0ABS4UK11_9ACTN|nr:LacI family DNA-binding transcriptional regulator [Kribbella aluminosa]MBP2351991.1 DNA-binding LacI/PurR family transcriptional regulator [Kribbella aluminosa]
MTARRTVTIRDVASHAGVSMTTVSDVVNGKGRVDPSTRQRVLDSVRDVGWRPRRSARALRSGETGIFALCFPRREHGVQDWLLNADYDMALVAACAAAAVDSGRQLLLAPRPTDLEDLARLDVDGVIIADPQERDPALRILDQAGIPTVTVERDIRRADTWWVGTDNAGGATSALDHLAGRGAVRIALLTADARWSWFADTTAAYRAWCAEHRRRPLIRTIDADDPRTAAAQAVHSLLRLKNPPDAILALPQGSALGVLDAAELAGVDVPADLKLIAGIDSQTLLVSQPPVTAIDQQPMRIAKAAVELLITRVSGADAPGPTLVSTELVVRRSTAGAR